MSQAAERIAMPVEGRRLRLPRHDILRRVLGKPQGLTGLALLLAVIFSAVFAPAIAPYPPHEMAVGPPLAPPSRANILGTDQFGRDVFSRIVYGGRISLQVGLIAVSIGGSVGLLLGTVAGYAGGWADDVAMRFVDVLLAFPGVLLALAVVIVLGSGLYNLMIAVGIGSIPTIARVVRGSVLEIRERDFVIAARALGSPDLRILVRHILPNIMAPYIVLLTLNVALAILAGSSLSFLGIGVKPPASEWGLMLSDGRNFIRAAWWVGTFPGLAITAAVIGINLLGDALRDALDPRLRGVR